MRITLVLALLSISLRLCLVANAQPLFPNGSPTRPAAAIDLPLTFNRLTLEEGLSQSDVYDILQDRRGFMWFATGRGLNRFDGYSFTVYGFIPFDSTSLPSSWIYSLYEDRSGTLWVGTEAGLSRMDSATGTFTHFVHDPDDSASVSDNRILALHEDQSGALWVGTRQGLNKLDHETGRFTRFRHNADDASSLSHDRVNAIYEDWKGTLWVSTANGLNRFNPATGTFARHFHTPNTPEVALGYQHRRNTVSGMYDDPDQPGMLWIASESGLIHFDSETGRHELYAPSPADPAQNVVIDIAPDPRAKGVIWVATNGGGLYRFDTSSEKFTPYRHDPGNLASLSANRLSSLYVDGTGLVWVGSLGGGLNVFDPDVWRRFVHYRHVPNNPNSLNDNIVWSLYEDRSGMLWIGTQDGGLSRLDRATGRFTRYIHDPSSPATLSGGSVYAVYEDLSGSLWVATSRGLSTMDPDSPGTFTRYVHDPNNPGSMAPSGASFISQDRAGTMWFGGDRGLYRMNPETPGVFTRFENDPTDSTSLSSNLIHDIHEALNDDGTLWIGTSRGGLNRFDTRTETFTRYQYDPRDPNSVSNNTVLCIQERTREPGVLWIGTDGGLNRFDTRTGAFTLFTEADGLADNTVYGILEDEEGRLWMSTNKGISRFDTATGTFRTYDVGRGVQAKEFNSGAYFRSPRTGEMFFGGINGFNAFYPGQVTVDPTPPRVAFTEFRLFNDPVVPGPNAPLRRPIYVTESIRLNHTQNSMTFEFVALHYKNPEENTYAYMLEGFDADWVQAGTQHTARYAKLPPGAYTFRVKAANADGIWNEEGASLRVIILPPWWRTWWAYTLYTLFVIGGVFAFYRLHRRRLILKEREQAALREKDLRAEAAEHLANYLQSENDRKTQELEHARLVQLSMLPRSLPVLPDVEIAAHMQTATEVGGDYYDFHVGIDGTLTFAIGDATGHGVQAGTMVTAMKSLWNAFAQETDLEAVMRKSSEALKRMHLPKIYMALAFGRLKGHTLELVGAGMPPAFISRAATGDIEEITLKGMPLGSPGKFPYRRQCITLAQGDTVILMSDGFPELRGESSEILGYDRMAGLIAETVGRSPEQIIRHFNETIKARCTSHAPDDDVTFIVLRAKITAERDPDSVDITMGGKWINAGVSGAISAQVQHTVP